MLLPPSIGLRIVGPRQLNRLERSALRPGEMMTDGEGIDRRLPRFFYEIPSWEAALDIKLAPHFGLWELIDVDVREQEAVRLFPRYVPCAIAVLAAHLEVLREEIGRVVRIAANGGYRSPSHSFATKATPHSWGTAANIYRIGDDLLDSRETIEKYIEITQRAVPTAWVRPFGDTPGYAFDHIHIDIGYVEVEPHGIRAAE